MSWLKQGEQSAALAKTHATEVELAKAKQGKMFRFWIKEGEEAPITFVDGDLSPQGFLVPPRYYEHSLYLNGSYNNHFVCPEKTSPELGQKCPICEAGDRPSLVTLFTIIDHREFTSNGKTYKDTPRLLVAKPQSFEILHKIAVKRGGLAGARFDVSRVGDKSASIGSMFDFIEKTDVAELKKKYERTVKVDGQDKVIDVFSPANYEEEVIFHSESELRALGFGTTGLTGAAPLGSKPSGAGVSSPAGSSVGAATAKIEEHL